MSRVILLNGGGMDSLVTLAHLCTTYPPESITSLHYWYGQKAYHKEVHAVVEMAKHYGVIVRLAQAVDLPGSIITDGVPVDTALPHYVPQRNLILIACAAAFAQSIDCNSVAGGWQSADTECPDVQNVWLQTARRIIRNGGFPDFELLSPLQPLTKCEVIAMGDELGVPWGLSWSCFYGDQRPCGACLGCTRRGKAFRTYTCLTRPDLQANVCAVSGRFDTKPLEVAQC